MTDSKYFRLIARNSKNYSKCTFLLKYLMQMVHGSNPWNKLCKIDNLPNTFLIVPSLTQELCKIQMKILLLSNVLWLPLSITVSSLIDGYTIRLSALTEESHGTFSMCLSRQTTPNQLLGNYYSQSLWTASLMAIPSGSSHLQNSARFKWKSYCCMIATLNHCEQPHWWLNHQALCTYRRVPWYLLDVPVPSNNSQPAARALLDRYSWIRF